jgi:glycosyltransferase A (GT-A) superfamily protein (DUF2064 family)
MDAGIAIFVKTPGRSPLKTRLAADLGVERATRWYLLAAEAVAAVAREAAPGRVYWAVAEDDAAADPLWRALPTLPQGDGGLGERMHRVHAALVARHGAGLLLGADTPQLEARALRDAIAWLRAPSARLAIGGALDGGFRTIGANREIALERWVGVPYSRAETAAHFRAALDGCGQWLELGTLTDVDTSSDLGLCAAALRALPNPLPEQHALRDWMQEHLRATDTAVAR